MFWVVPRFSECAPESCDYFVSGGLWMGKVPLVLRTRSTDEVKDGDVRSSDEGGKNRREGQPGNAINIVDSWRRKERGFVL